MAVEFERKETYGYEDLLHIMKLLRSDEGCPWDREQTNESIRKNFVEEVYEAIEAIDTKDDTLLKEELGDVLLQVVFHAQIAKEEGRFGMDEVCDGICKKLIQRHPHIFADVVANDTETVLSNWDAIKKKTKGQQSYTEVLQSVSTYLPALMRSYKIQHKAAKVGFDWDNIEDVYAKIYEELDEVKQAQGEKNTAHLEEEMGDLLFAVVNLSRFLEVDPETSLNKVCQKFIKRFNYIETHAEVRYNRNILDLTLAEMDTLWEESKEKETL